MANIIFLHRNVSELIWILFNSLLYGGVYAEKYGLETVILQNMRMIC